VEIINENLMDEDISDTTGRKSVFMYGELQSDTIFQFRGLENPWFDTSASHTGILPVQEDGKIVYRFTP
jgi:hypothetical protein